MIVASLTTIPPRIEDECRLTIDSLMNQVDIIYLCVSKTYKRFGTLTLPSYLQEEPYLTRVEVVFSEDYGPASKYLGALSIIKNKNAWVFVCDDDQEYHCDLIANMLSKVNNEKCVYQNRYDIFSRYGTQGGFIHGFVGLLIHSSSLEQLNDFPLPPCSRYIDDQWMSIFCFLKNIEILSTDINEYNQIYKVLNNNYEKIGKEPLAILGGRSEFIKNTCEFFGVDVNSTVITNRNNTGTTHN